MANRESVYSLVTKLCENQLATSDRRVRQRDVTKLRARAFELLLYRRKPISDPFWLPQCHLETQYLAWEYTVHFRFNQAHVARKIKICFDTISNSAWDEITKEFVLHFLLRLRQPLQKPREAAVVSRLNDSGYRVFQEEDFHLGPVASLSNKFSDRSLHTTSRRSRLFTPDAMWRLDAAHDASSSLNNSDEGLALASSPPPNIWEVVSKMTSTAHRSWESLGNPIPQLEKPFLSECGKEVYGLMDKVEYYYGNADRLKKRPKILSRAEYMRDLKYIILGIESDTFQAKEDVFILNSEVLFDGIPYHVFKKFSCLLVNCGICFKALQNMVSENTYATGDKYGAIYCEFCKAVRRYLTFYHAATFKFDENEGLLKIHAFMSNLSKPLFAVASICKVGTFKEPHGTSIPSGVDLLNYLYTKVFTAQSDRRIFLVLLGILFPCFQIYFIRYLRPWLLEGVLNDPHGEFFIRPSSSYLSARARPYWMRGFAISDVLVPNFLVDHASSILECGKSANLLKLCVAKSKICQYFMAHRPHLVQCCISQGALLKLERCIMAYELEMIAADGGTPFSLKTWLAMREDAKLIFSKCTAAKRAATIKRIEQQRLEKYAKEMREKNERYRLLREDYDKQLALKQEHKLAELAKELQEEEKLVAMRDRAERLIHEEAFRMIAHYEQLSQNATHLNAQIVNHVESIKKIQLEEEPKSISLPIPVETVDIDVLNANSESKTNENDNVNTEVPANNNPTFDWQANVAMNNADAQRYKQKVMGTSIGQTTKRASKANAILTEAQANKMKVRAVEYGETYSHEANRDYALRSKLAFNDNDFGKNAENNNNPPNDDESRLEMSPYLKTPNFELVKCDSPFTATASCSFSGTPAFETAGANVHLDLDCPMRVPAGDVAAIQTSTLDYFLRSSLALPLRVQTSLVRADLLKHFFVELKYLAHLKNLRKYYFLLDGDFCRSVACDLFKKLYEWGDARSLFNVTGLNVNTRHDGMCVKVYIDPAPTTYDLADINALENVSLQYEITWPMNILLSKGILTKYDEVFKFLMKVHRVAWILQIIFMDLKVLNKTQSRHAALLSCSPQYQRMQLWRHIMTHFIQTFQNYIVGEVLQSGWAGFQEELKSIDNIDDLYAAHSKYLKQIYFLCLLHPKSDMKKVVMNIFTVILKFYGYLRSREWTVSEIEFVHPNYEKLEEIFANFMVMAKYFFRAGRKLANAAYQPQFAQLIDLLDINGYYSARFQGSV